jgi:hypothetical protein
LPRVMVFMLVSLAVCSAMASLPALTFVLAVGWGISLLTGGLYLTRKQVALVAGVNILLLYFLTGSNSMFFYLGFFGLPFIVMSLFAADEAQGYYDILKRGIMAGIIGVSLFMGLIYLSTGGVGIAQLEEQLDNYFEESWQQYEKSGAMDFYEQKGIASEELKAQIDGFVHTTARHLPSFFYLESICAVFLVVYLTARICRRKKLQRLIKKPFSEEIMPWQVAWVVIAGLALWLLGKDNNPVIYLAGSNILIVCIPITVYFGLSALTYKVNRINGPARKGIILILLLLGIFLILSVIIFLAMLGLFDSLIDYRKLRSPKEE